MSRPIHPITMPKWGIEMQEGTITGWHAAVGQTLNKGDSLLDVETQKIVNSVESPITGTLRRIVAQTGETLLVGRLLGVYADSDVPDALVDDFIRNFKAVDASFDSEGSRAPSPAAAPATSLPMDGESRVSPIARRLAEKHGIDIGQVTGTGRNGRVSKEDVEAYLAARGPAGAAPAPASSPSAAPNSAAGAIGPAAGAGNPPTREKMTSMRATIARRLLESKQGIPHYRLSIDVEVGAIFAKRQVLKKGGTDVSVNDFLVRACALALTRHPEVNSTLDGDEISRYANADICVAVATGTGLVTPIVRAANTKSTAQIAADVRELIERARASKLAKEDITGGTFTISNLGMFGVDRFDAIINPPQVAILAAGAADDRVVVKNGAPAVAKVMTLTLSCDHRVVDGATGAKFLQTLRGLIETPESL